MRNVIIHPLSVLFFIFVFSGCFEKGKEYSHEPDSCTGKCIVITGHVYDVNRQKNVSNLDIQLKYYRYHTFGSTNLFLSQATTNAAGDYKFSVYSEAIFDDPGGYLEIIAVVGNSEYSDLEYTSEASIYVDGQSIYDSSYVVDLNIFPRAQLNLKFNFKTEGFSKVGYVYKFAHTKYHRELTYQTTTVPFSKVEIIPTFGHQNTEYEYGYDIDGKSYSFSNSVYIKAGETKVVEIEI